MFFHDSAGKLWFRSGDVGRMDAEGYVYIMDRSAACWFMVCNSEYDDSVVGCVREKMAVGPVC